MRVAGQSAGRGAIRGRAARGGGARCSLPRSHPAALRGRRGKKGARSAMAETIADTRRLISKPQNLNDAYGPPSNFLEIDVGNPQTVGVGRGRFTTYEIRVKVRARSGPARRGGGDDDAGGGPGPAAARRGAGPAASAPAPAGGRGRPAGSSAGYVRAPPAAGPGGLGSKCEAREGECGACVSVLGSGRLLCKREGCPRAGVAVTGRRRRVLQGRFRS